MKEIPKAYNPKDVEDKIYQKWEDSGYFNPDNLKLPKNADYFSISMPPPNRTGTLHTGHAVMLAYQDLMIRYNRLLGKRTLWLPGTDHAAIATQTKVEKVLFEKEKKTRYDLGKEKFLQKVNEYAEESSKIINQQVRKMGSSCDWSRERYTLDDGLSQVVRYAFVKMYEAGLIERDYRIVNWCPRCNSTLSDDEVEYKEVKAKLYTFKYAKDFPLAIATTRPETKLGDTAVAVNPKDKRYKKFIGKTYTVDLGHGKQEIKIVAEESVDPDFGTGALGVTPAHSIIDYEIALKNNLPLIKVIGEDGKMTKEAGKDYAGLTAEKARDKFVIWLEKQSLMEKVEDTKQNLSICYRCGSAIEPLPSLQWFVRVNKKVTLKGNKFFQNKTIREVALQVVKERNIKIIPERFEKTYYQWLENLRDWCISRQIWFGHPIPVWYKKAKKGIKITFIRHGQSEGNLGKVGSGHLDHKLTEQGKEDVRKLKNKINAKEFDYIFSSDLARAKETAEILYGEDGHKIITDERLREIDFGDLEGKDAKEIDKYRVSGFPNGETYQQVRDRVLDFLAFLIDNYDGKKIGIVAHSGTWKVLEIILNSASFSQEHLEIHATREPVEYHVDTIYYVGLEAPKGDWEQDGDTLDTWFSSGLWTFSTLMDKNFSKYKTWEDWLKNSPDMQYHPTTVMETGYDILFFWVARMIIQTTFLLGDIPFKTVYLHGLIRDEKGRKMSKSLGNVVDPLDLIDKFGTDALRIAMISGTAAGMDSRLYDEKVEGGRNFVNKLWNISRYILSSVSKIILVEERPEAKTLADEWILAKLANVISEATLDLENFNFSGAADALREFTWSDFADWYLEISKLQRQNSKLAESTEKILLYVLGKLLILWHPFIPFVTEEIWGNLGCKELLMVQSWPSALELDIEQKEKNDKNIFYPFWKFEEIVMSIRNLRADFKVDPAKKVAVSIVGKNLDKIKFNEMEEAIMFLARLDKLEIEKSKPKNSVSHVLEGVGEICLHLEGLVDMKKEKARIESEIESVEGFIKSLEQKLKNKDFVKKAPKEVVEKEEYKLKEQKEKLEKLEEQLKSLK